jgi:hypothetical protein
MKARAIDNYIRRATAGLPHFERIDTAAELRVNLNVRIKELMLEGHSREEAEFLAIKDMGDAFTANRAFLGHAFTHRLGWALVVLTLLAGAGWWLWQNWYSVFPWETEVRAVELTMRDMDRTLQNDKRFVERGKYLKYEFNLPRGTKQVEVALVSREETVSGVLSGQFPGQYPYSRKLSPVGANKPLRYGLLLSNGIVADKSNFEIQQMIVEPIATQTYKPFGEIESESVFNMVSAGVGSRWAKFAQPNGVRPVKNSWGWISRKMVGKSNIRLNEWFLLVEYSIDFAQKLSTPYAPPNAAVFILVKASDQLLGNKAPKTRDIRLGKFTHQPVFVNSKGQQIIVR